MSSIEQFSPDPGLFRKKETSFEDVTHHMLYGLSYSFNPLFREGVLMREQLREDLGFIQDTYGLQIQMGRQTKLDAATIGIPSKLTLAEAVPAVHIIREEITKYPQNYINYCNIERFRLVKEVRDLEDKDNPEAGGIAVEDSKHIYLGFDGDLGFFRRTFHHEVFHRGDQTLLEQAGKLLPQYQHQAKLKATFFDRDWANLNPTGEYAYFYNRYKPRKGQSHFEPIKGFAIRYGKMDEMEDRATIAEILMTEPNTLFRRATNDAVLRKKINKIIKIFSERSQGIMNLDYFQALAQQ